jgi:hypothetical protein
MIARGFSHSYLMLIGPKYAAPRSDFEHPSRGAAQWTMAPAVPPCQSIQNRQRSSANILFTNGLGVFGKELLARNFFAENRVADIRFRPGFQN